MVFVVEFHFVFPTHALEICGLSVPFTTFLDIRTVVLRNVIECCLFGNCELSVSLSRLAVSENDDAVRC